MLVAPKPTAEEWYQDAIHKVCHANHTYRGNDEEGHVDDDFAECCFGLGLHGRMFLCVLCLPDAYGVVWYVMSLIA